MSPQTAGFAIKGDLCAKPLVAGNRPNETDDDVVRIAASALVDAMRREFGIDGFESPDTDEQVAAAIRHGRDGYEIARDLERRFYWSVDAAMVEILDGAWSEISGAQRKLEAAWVEISGVRPKLNIGDKVRFDGNVAEVTAINTRQGKYTLLVEALGHVRTGLGTHGFIVNWEIAEGCVA